ncbi:hypothetical protein PILCRDRAFT_136527 [Piloderma croceum F 1598]|uniref:CHAT domain-containing protein n=1 Tax=Piloderma croceum (strain F 1598) TaxID=765440 RepID=A0A0C3CPT2_PILCF|nr:hypothetical protein PILCRDRAFT_136527 [Piloderma croceum F 1598]
MLHRRVRQARTAADCFREAISFTPHDNSNRFQCLAGFARSLTGIMPLLGMSSEDEEEAYDIHSELLWLIQSDGTMQSLRQRASHSEGSTSANAFIKSVSAFRTSPNHVNCRPFNRFHALALCALFAHHQGGFVLASELYMQAFRILPLLNWATPSVVIQLDRWGLNIASFTSDAAACMFSLSESVREQEQHYLSLSIELLDQGRSMWWSHTCSMCKRNLDELRKHSPRLAEDLDRIGHALDADDQPNYHALYEEWEQHIRQVRQLPEFEHFLCPFPISKLRRAADGGSVVVINHSDYRRDALILGPDNNLALVRFRSDFIIMPTSRTVVRRWIRPEARNLRRGLPAMPPTTDLNAIVIQTWRLIGHPVIRKLEIMGVLGSDSVSKPRVWWCLPPDWLYFFPVHASHSSDVHAAGMMDLVVSSYTPTLSSLLRPQHLSKFYMLTVGQPVCDGRLPLNNVIPEMEAIHNHLSSEHMSFLDGPGATVHTVSSALSTCTWAHFACHGNNHKQPMESSLIMHREEQLTVAAVAQSVPRTGGFAFFSTCQFAPAAACLQFLGLYGAIGTMWSVEDMDAFTIARQFYAELFKTGVTNITAADAALALNRACCYVRDRDEVPLEYWASYVHFGM